MGPTLYRDMYTSSNTYRPPGGPEGATTTLLGGVVPGLAPCARRGLFIIICSERRKNASRGRKLSSVRKQTENSMEVVDEFRRRQEELTSARRECRTQRATKQSTLSGKNRSHHNNRLRSSGPRTVHYRAM